MSVLWYVKATVAGVCTTLLGCKLHPLKVVKKVQLFSVTVNDFDADEELELIRSGCTKVS